MASTQTYLETLFRVGSFAGLPDGALLERFIGGPPDVAEAAFAALVERYGVRIRRPCRQVTGDYHAAEDAAQATFLVLARSARSLRSTDSLAAWLHGVARRVSARANADATRRRAREQRAAERAAEAPPRSEPRPEVHEELARLPERYRLPIVLCHLEGLSCAQAAEQLRCPVRTVQTRLARGRERLRSGLVRRGLGPVVGPLVAATAPGSASAAWAQATVRLAMHWSKKGGPATAGSVPAASALAREVLRAMTIHQLKIASGVVLLAVASGAGAWAWTGSRVTPPGASTTAEHAGADEPRNRPPADAAARPLGPGSAVKGRVTGPDGKPLAGAEVRSPILKIREKFVTTGPDGRFTITAEEPPRGEFALRIDAPGLASKMFTIETSPRPPSTPPLGPERAAYLMEPTGEIGIDLGVGRGSTVTGRIVRDGKPVPRQTLGLWRDAHGFDALLGPMEVKADVEGRFRFPHAPANSPCWAYLPTGSLERAGAVRPWPLRTPGEDSSIDLGDVRVLTGRVVSGRVVLADGRPLPANAEVLASADHAGGSLRTKLDRSGRFTLAGLPEGQVEVCAYFPDDNFYAPAGYRASSRNKCLDPLNPWRLVGRVDRDVADLTILFERGGAAPPPSMAPGLLAAFKKVQAGPITGVPPGRDE